MRPEPKADDQAVVKAVAEVVDLTEGVRLGVASHGVAEPVKGVVGDQVVVAAKDVPLHDAAEGRIGAVLLSDGSEP